ncbi:MAG TPA: type II secretion system protein [Polyangiales bacterium]|jgi:prepilin-type N-terminal cleavage/methylation domain-containing protein|nr:type II secretion system protein [Polyangiales bacterium]
MKRTRSTAGYTLLELMIVVLIMGAMAAMIAPGLGEFMADARASAASEELIRLNRVIRARVNQTGLAHLMLFQASDDAAGSNGLGRIRVWEGMNNRCSQTPWMQAINGTAANGFQPIETVDMGDTAYNLSTGSTAATASDTSRQVIRIAASTNPKLAVLCFEPGGNTFRGASAGDAPAIGYNFTPQTSAETFSVIRSLSRGGTMEERGVTRDVIFPAGGNGRMRF